MRERMDRGLPATISNAPTPARRRRPRLARSAPSEDTSSLTRARARCIRRAVSSPSMPSVTNDRADVTVIVPTHNRARLLGRAVASVQRQTVDGWELVCVDDASTDDTAAVIEAVADPRIRLIRLPRNGGAGRARNRGVATARGDYVAFLD